MTSKVSNTPKPYAYWNDLRRSDPRTYYSPQTQRLVVNSRVELGSKVFWDGIETKDETNE
jgi:hypothetical protein